MIRVLTLFFSTKYTKPCSWSQEDLNQNDMDVIGEKLEQFFKAFSLPDETIGDVLGSEFTMIRTEG